MIGSGMYAGKIYLNIILKELTMIDQRKYFYKEVLMPTLEASKRTLDIFDLVGREGKLEPKFKTASAIHSELTQLVIDYDKLTLIEANERFKDIIRRNAPAKHSLYRTVINAWRKAFSGRVGRAGKNSDSDKS